jgi:hypothetical protein
MAELIQGKIKERIVMKLICIECSKEMKDKSDLWAVHSLEGFIGFMCEKCHIKDQQKRKFTKGITHEKSNID